MCPDHCYHLQFAVEVQGIKEHGPPPSLLLDFSNSVHCQFSRSAMFGSICSAIGGARHCRGGVPRPALSLHCQFSRLMHASVCIGFTILKRIAYCKVDIVQFLHCSLSIVVCDMHCNFPEECYNLQWIWI